MNSCQFYFTLVTLKRFSTDAWSGSLANGMAKRTAQKRKVVGFTAANRRGAMPLSRAATLGRPNLVILLALGAITFGIYAQVIGHQFITFDDNWYIEENAMVNRGVTLAGFAWAFTTFHAG